MIVVDHPLSRVVRVDGRLLRFVPLGRFGRLVRLIPCLLDSACLRRSEGVSVSLPDSGDAGDEGNGLDASAPLTVSSPRVGILVSISAQPHTLAARLWRAYGALIRRTMESTGDAALVSSQTHVATILSCPGAPWKRPRENL